jgi:tartrate dehydrogenase/decarboxylase/D-malate dehydrogenase
VATKSNGIAISMPWWDARADEVGKATRRDGRQAAHRHPSARFVLQPQRFDVGGREQPVR